MLAWSETHIEISPPKNCGHFPFSYKTYKLPATYPEGFCYRFTGMGSQILIPKKKRCREKKT